MSNTSRRFRLPRSCSNSPRVKSAGDQDRRLIVYCVGYEEEAQSDFLIQDLKSNKKLVVGKQTQQKRSQRRKDEVLSPHLYESTLDEAAEDGEAIALYGKYRNAATRLLSSRYSSAADGEPDNNVIPYGFRSPVKKGRMLERAQQTVMVLSREVTPEKSFSSNILHSPKNVTPVRRSLLNSTLIRNMEATPSPKKRLNRLQESPRSRRDDTNSTPLQKLRLKVSEDEPPTPYSVRYKVVKNIEKMDVTDDDEEESDEEVSSSSSNDDDESEEEKENGIIHNIVRSSSKVKSHGGTDEYFEAHGDKIRTSDQTLSKLQTPRLSAEDLKFFLEDVEVKYRTEMGHLVDEGRKMYPRWLMLLREEFNVVTYGVGSKRALLNGFHDFLAQKDPSGHVLIVNGYFPSLTLRHILLEGIWQNILGQELVGVDDATIMCDKICHYLESRDEFLYLIVHNLDGCSLRLTKCQEALAKLAHHRRVHLIASIDHINAPLLWDTQLLSRFNFLWFDATTFLPYTEETLNENSLMLRHGSGGGEGSGSRLALSSLSRVFESLTPNAKDIYMIIVRYQMNFGKETDATETRHDQGISFKDLYQQCRKAFLVNSDLTLRAQLTEFRDHKLIRQEKEWKTVSTTSPYLWITQPSRSSSSIWRQPSKA